MGRVEKFRQLRNLRQRFILSVVVIFILLIGGLCVADYSVNNLIGDNKGVNVIALKNYKAYVEITFLNQKFYINTQYINRDLDKLKQEIKKLFSNI